jgi:two-component system, LytTR family, response regulator
MLDALPPCMLRALLIEDEAAARTDLKNKLSAHPEVTVVGEAATLGTARALLASQPCDVVFLDIQLIGGDSFGLVAEVPPAARIVFVTAYDRYAVRAFEINALDYLLKPVKPERLAEAVRRLAGAPRPATAAEPETPDAALRLDDVVYLRNGQHARFAPVADISVITAHDNYSEVQLADGVKIFLRKSLKAWEATLPATHFMRVHRTQIVNLGRVTRYQRDGDEHTLLFVAGASDPVPASRYRWSDLRERLGAVRKAQ